MRRHNFTIWNWQAIRRIQKENQKDEQWLSKSLLTVAKLFVLSPLFTIVKWIKWDLVTSNFTSWCNINDWREWYFFVPKFSGRSGIKCRRGKIIKIFLNGGVFLGHSLIINKWTSGFFPKFVISPPSPIQLGTE